jgi:hypothetical protein
VPGNVVDVVGASVVVVRGSVVVERGSVVVDRGSVVVERGAVVVVLGTVVVVPGAVVVVFGTVVVVLVVVVLVVVVDVEVVVVVVHGSSGVVVVVVGCDGGTVDAGTVAVGSVVEVVVVGVSQSSATCCLRRKPWRSSPVVDVVEPTSGADGSVGSGLPPVPVRAITADAGKARHVDIATNAVVRHRLGVMLLPSRLRDGTRPGTRLRPRRC